MKTSGISGKKIIEDTFLPLFKAKDLQLDITLKETLRQESSYKFQYHDGVTDKLYRSNRTTDFILNCTTKYNEQEVKRIQQESNFQLVFTDDKVYDLDNKKFKLIDESYNANPLSVKNAIINFNSIKKEKFKKYLILGDMLELGHKSEMYHKNLSKVINNTDIDKVFIKGEKTLFTYKYLNKNKRGNILQNKDDIDFILNNVIANKDFLMIKGSNATGLNSISKKMIKGLNVI